MAAPPINLLKNTCSSILGSTAQIDVSLMRSWPRRFGACALCMRRYSSKAFRVLFWTAWTCTASVNWSISGEVTNDRSALECIAYWLLSDITSVTVGYLAISRDWFIWYGLSFNMGDVYLNWYERLPCKDGKRKEFLIPLKTLVLSYYVKDNISNLWRSCCTCDTHF